MTIPDTSQSIRQLMPLQAGLTNDRWSSITLRQLQVFATVASTRNFGRAADHLYLTQPAVSHQLKQLEDALGARVISRSRGRRTVELTDVGRVLLQGYAAVAEALAQVTAEIESLRQLSSGELSFGCGPGFGGYVLPRLHDDFRESYPNITVHLQIDDNPNLLNALRRGQLDLAVMVDPPNDHSTVRERLGAYEVVLVCRPDHPLARLRHMPFLEVASERLLLPDKHVALRRALEKLANHVGAKLNVAMEVNYMEARLQAVYNGLGIAAIWRGSVIELVQRGKLSVLHVDELPLRLGQYLVRRSGEMNRPTQAFRERILMWSLSRTASTLGQ